MDVGGPNLSCRIRPINRMNASRTSRSVSHVSHQFRGKSTASGIVGPSAQRPNRLTQYFGKMKEICPDAIKEYARCVTDKNENEKLKKSSCQKEFDAVKDCLRFVRKQETFV